MDEQLRLLLEIAQRLEGAGIAYMVTGSMALAAYVTPRATRDIDFVVELGIDDVDRVVGLFEADCFIDRDQVRDAVRRESMFNVIHEEWVIKADFVIRKDEPYRREEFRRRRTIDVEGTAVAFVSPEDLVLSKLCWAKISPSELQERDVAEILAADLELDHEYMARWADRLSVSDHLGRLADG